MSNFSDISRMNLADLERKGYHPEEDEDEDVVTVDEAEAAAIAEARAELDAEETEAEVVEDGECSEMDAALEKAMQEDDPNAGPMKMMDPTGTYYLVDADIEESDLREFLLRHSYSSPMTLIVSVLCIFYLGFVLVAKPDGVGFGVFAVIVMDVFYPLTLVWRAKSTKKTVPAYQNTFHYMFDEWGVHLELMNQAVDVDWKRVFKIKFYKGLCVIYTGKTNAFLVPYKPMGSQKEEICNFLKEHTRQVVLK